MIGKKFILLISISFFMFSMAGCELAPEELEISCNEEYGKIWNVGVNNEGFWSIYTAVKEDSLKESLYLESMDNDENSVTCINNVDNTKLSQYAVDNSGHVYALLTKNSKSFSLVECHVNSENYQTIIDNIQKNDAGIIIAPEGFFVVDDNLAVLYYKSINTIVKVDLKNKKILDEKKLDDYDFSTISFLDGCIVLRKENSLSMLSIDDFKEKQKYNIDRKIAGYINGEDGIFIGEKVPQYVVTKNNIWNIDTGKNLLEGVYADTLSNGKAIEQAVMKNGNIYLLVHKVGNASDLKRYLALDNLEDSDIIKIETE